MHCVVVCRFKLQQLCEIYEGMAAAGGPLKDMSMFFNLYYGLLGHTHSYTRLAGCSDLVCGACNHDAMSVAAASANKVHDLRQALRLMKSAHVTFAEADATAATLDGAISMIAWTTDTHTYSSPAYFACQMKRRHWLVARDEIDEAEFCAWLPAPECGTAAQSKLKDNTPFSNG